jgi:hypothetical protein
MAKLTIEFNCMCMFVPDPANGSVHVLMPVTAQGGHPRHEVRLRHSSFKGKEKKEGRLMEGLELVLRGRGKAHTDLIPSTPSDPQGELPNLSTIAGSKPVDPALLTSTKPSGVVSRITLLSGKVGEIRAHGKKWKLGGKDRVLAFQVTWTIDDVGELEWHPLHDSGAVAPLASLRDLKPEPGTADVYKLEIHHVEAGTLTNPSKVLTAQGVRHHFGAFYTPLRVTRPGGDLLPDPIDDGFEGSPDFKCVGIQASLS